MHLPFLTLFVEHKKFWFLQRNKFQLMLKFAIYLFKYFFTRGFKCAKDKCVFYWPQLQCGYKNLILSFSNLNFSQKCFIFHAWDKCFVSRYTTSIKFRWICSNKNIVSQICKFLAEKFKIFVRKKWSSLESKYLVVK